MSWDGTDRRERRHGPDLLVKLMTALAVLGWVSMLVTVFLYGMARPEAINNAFWPLARKMNMIWNTELMSMVLYFLMGNFLVGAVGLFINTRRHKRKRDHYSLSLVLLTMLAAIGILLMAFGYAY